MVKRRLRGGPTESKGIHSKTDEAAIDEQQKLIKAEMEQKVTRILKLVKNKDLGKKGGPKKEPEVVGLVEDLYRNYQSIHEQYDHLREETERSVNSKKENASVSSSSTSSSDSDTEYFSSEEMDSTNSNSQNGQVNSNELGKQVLRNQALAEVDSLRRQLECERNQKRELEERKNKEISENMILISNLKEELAEKIEVERRLLEEREGVLVQIKDLETEVENLDQRRSEAEQQNNRLRSENQWLNTRNSELEMTLTGKENEASSQMIASMKQIKNLKQQLESLQAEKNQLGHEKDECKKEFSRCLSGIELDNNELKSKIDDQERILKEKDETVASLSEKYQQAKNCLPDVASILLDAERKMEELAEEFRSSLEHKIRLLSERILVAEQLHTESRKNYRARNRSYEQGKRQLEQKIANYEAELINLSNINELGIDRMVTKFEEESVNLLNHIVKITEELTMAKYWARTRNSEIKQLKSKLTRFGAQMEEKEEQEFLLREKLWNLEAKISKEGGDKLNLIRTLSQFEKKTMKMEIILKEKDVELFRIAEEKREAIRQLCAVIEHHRSKYHHLREGMHRNKVRSR